MNKKNEEQHKQTGLEERVQREHPEVIHDRHLDDDNDGRDHAEERHGPAVQLRNGRNVPLAPSCAVRGCGITRVVAPLTAPTACVPWRREPPHVARFTGVNRETEERVRRSRRVSEPRAAENGRRDEEEERTHAATGRVQ